MKSRFTKITQWRDAVELTEGAMPSRLMTSARIGQSTAAAGALLAVSASPLAAA